MLIERRCYVAVDFDGTVTDTDIIDALLEEFAPPAWRDVEALWESGRIGSRECLERQMSLIRQPLSRLVGYVDRFAIDDTFADLVGFLRERDIPFAVVSDGFGIFIERLLRNGGVDDVPVLANILAEEEGRLKTVFPFADPECDAANCKCSAVSDLCAERSLILVGDGRSDYCLASRAAHVFSKKKLTEHCRANGIPHTPFARAGEIARAFAGVEVPAAPVKTFSAGKD